MTGEDSTGVRSVTADGFRETLSHLAGGVVIVTTRGASGGPRGMTATAVCSVSLEPPLVMACMSHTAATHRAVEQSEVFALNILPATATGLARRFASARPDKFEGITVEAGPSGAPLIRSALAYCDCRVERSVEAGDHTIFIGRVLATGSAGRPGDTPLLYWRGAYGSVAPLLDEDGREP